MPLNIDFLQVLLHMLNFVILAGGLTFLLFKPINKFLENRKAHFEKLERDNAESAETNAKAKAEYEQKLSNAEAEIAEMKQNAEKDMASAAEGYINDAKDKASTLLKAAETEAENRNSLSKVLQQVVENFNYEFKTDVEFYVGLFRKRRKKIWQLFFTNKANVFIFTMMK